MYRLFHICDAVASLEDKDVGRISDPVPARTYLHVKSSDPPPGFGGTLK